MSCPRSVSSDYLSVCLSVGYIIGFASLLTWLLPQHASATHRHSRTRCYPCSWVQDHANIHSTVILNKPLFYEYFYRRGISDTMGRKPLSHFTTAKALGTRLTHGVQTRLADPKLKDHKELAYMVDHLVNRHIGTVKPKETTMRPQQGATDSADKKMAEQRTTNLARAKKCALQSQFMDSDNKALEELPLAETHPITGRF